MNQWIRLEDNHPKAWQWCLAWHTRYEDVHKVQWHPEYKAFSDVWADEITHWQPLPSAPEVTP